MGNQNSQTDLRTELRRIFWPIEKQELKKFLPMAGMMFFILFNYSILRSVKDGFVVTSIGAESISFLKTYFVLPSAIIAMIIYSKLCNVMSQKNVFITITTFFTVYLLVFGLVIYPYPELFHPSVETVAKWEEAVPFLKWFFRIFGHWSYALLYVMAELWGSVMLSLLFWQFANQITRIDEAKRFYSMFGMLGNIALVLVGPLGDLIINKNIFGTSEHLRLIPIILINASAGVAIMAIYLWIHKNVLTDPRYYDAEKASGGGKKKKAKLSLGESFKLIATSKYIGFIAILVLAYGISINLVEGIWKAKLHELYPNKNDYTSYMLNFQSWQGAAAIVFMIIGSNILRRVKWGTAAVFTPVMILFTGLIFFGFIFFGNSVEAMGIIAASPLIIATTVGMIQNVLSKATKYSLFDSTKEMAYIPLDDELKTKGKAAVDVVGGRLGKTGGGVIQSSFFLLGFTFQTALPWFAAVFFVIVILWIVAVQSLNKQYQNKIKDHSY